jgi:superfamily II RNA helicase
MNRLIPAALLSLPIALAACGDRDHTATAPQAPQAPQKAVSADDVTRDAKQAVDTATDYAQMQKREFIAKAEREVQDLHASLEDLKKRASTATSETKDKMQDALRDLEREQDELQVQQKLAELKSATADTWQSAKAGFEDAFEKLRESYEKAKRESS